MTTNGSLNRKLRMALVGGGQGAFIGRVHATAAVMDNRAALVAGAPPVCSFAAIAVSRQSLVEVSGQAKCRATPASNFPVLPAEI